MVNFYLLPKRKWFFIFDMLEIYCILDCIINFATCYKMLNNKRK